MRRRRLGVIIGIACSSAGAAGGRAAALPPPPALTTTTIIPIWVLLDVSPDAGAPGSVVSVHGANCVYGATAVDVTLSALEQPDVLVDSAHAVPDANGAWTADLEIPADAVIGGPAYAVNARCSQPTTTIFYYQPSSVAVTAETATSSTSSSASTTSTAVATTTEPSTTDATEVIAGVVETLAPPASPTGAKAAASPSALLPRTGADNAPGLMLFALSLVGAGSLLVLSRHRSRRTYR